MTPSTMNQADWLDTFQELLRHYLGPFDNSPLVNVCGVVAVVVGLFLAFRCWKYERAVVSMVGLVLGAWLGYSLSLLVQTPAPITAAVFGVGVTLLAYRTYRWWLAAGSVIVLFMLAVVFQLGRGDLQRYLPPPGDAGRMDGEWIERLPRDVTEQMSNLAPTWSQRLAGLKDPVARELKALGPMGWLLPVAAALLGGLLAYWALRAFAVVWIGYAGSLIALLGAVVLLCVHWPQVQSALISQPKYLAGGQLAIWALGLIWQAREARIPKKPEGGGGKGDATRSRNADAE